MTHQVVRYAFSLECMQPVCEQTHVTHSQQLVFGLIMLNVLWTYMQQQYDPDKCDCDLFDVDFLVNNNCHKTSKTAERKHAA